MPVTFDAAATGISGSTPSGLPFTVSWEHTSDTASNPQPGSDTWFVYFKTGADVLTDSIRTCTWGGVPMESKGVIALAGNSLVAECFTLVGQPLGPQPVSFTYNNTSGIKPTIIRADSMSYKGVLGFGALQKNSTLGANGSLAAISDTGELLSACHVARAANISNTSGTDRFIKNNVTPRVAITDQAGAATVNITMTNNKTDWGIGAVRVMTGASEPPPPPPTPPTLPAVNATPLGGVMMALPTLFTPNPDITVTPLASAAPAYPSPTTFGWDTHAAKFRVGGELILSDANSMQCGVNAVSGQSIDTNPRTAGLTSFEVEWWTTGGRVGNDFTIKFRSFADSDYLILVDDMPVTTTWQNFGTVGYRYQRITIDDDLPHRVRVLNGYNGFCGVIVAGGGGIEPAGPRDQIAVTGDSYIQGAGSASEPGPVGAGGICGHLALLLGMEVLNFGQGTTGYLADGVGGDRSRFGSAARLAKLDEWTPDTIVVFGGGNDTSADPAAVATAANTMWNAIATAHPTAKLIVVGIQSPNLFDATRMTALNTALRTAALANANVDLWIDEREPEFWVTDVTEDLFITKEFPASIHPGKAGSMNIALRMVQAIAMKYLTAGG